MTVKEFCLKKTNAHELVVIRDAGWIVASVWIDYEDIFLIPDRVKDKVIRQDSWGTLNIVTKHGDELEVPCHYLDVWWKAPILGAFHMQKSEKTSCKISLDKPHGEMIKLAHRVNRLSKTWNKVYNGICMVLVLTYQKGHGGN